MFSLAFEKLATYETTGAISHYQVTAFTPEPECTFDDDCADGQVCEEGICECPQIANCKTQNTASCACITCEDGFEKNDAGECVEAAAKSCDDGEIITAKNGDKFCKSTNKGFWSEADDWCSRRGRILPSVGSLCGPALNNGDVCENLNAIASVNVWTSTKYSEYGAYYIDLSSGAVGYQEPYAGWEYYIICK